MRRLAAILAIACLCVWCASMLEGREATRPGFRVMRASPEEMAPGPTDPGLRGLYEEAAVDTYCLVWYDFESMNWQGWTRVDQTAQRGTFFHVDDFAGLGGGDFGRLVPIQGTKSMWCGARPNISDPYMCSWAKAPGYANGWRQWLTTAPFNFSGAITLSYHITWDSEPDYDCTRVEYDRGGDSWQEIASYDGHGSTASTHVLRLTQFRTKLRFKFASDGAWSDQDGLWNTDGACTVDSIRLSDEGGYVNSFEDFETAPVGATTSGIWSARHGDSFSTYSGLFSSLNDKDPCGEDFTSIIVFFIGSPVPSSSYPGLYDTPFCKGAGGITAPCQDELVVSPLLDTRKYSTGCNSVQDGVIPPGELSSLSGFVYRFAVYRDNPLPNLVYYQWHVRNVVNGCPGPWLDRNYGFWDADLDWLIAGSDVSDLITSDTVQLAVGAVDMCNVWYIVNGNCAKHTPAPWFDNVRLYRYNASGPQFWARDLDLFQDNFPGLEYDLESYVRADAANDIFTNDNPVIRPGDSIVVNCSSPMGGGVAGDPTYGGPAVYLHVKCTYIGPAPTKPNLYGPMLAGSTVHGTAPPITVNYNYVSDDGVWTVIQCDTARTAAGIFANYYCVDLNDALFTRGYMIEYYFTARDVAGEERALPKWARSRGPYYEFTCLPTKSSNVLFVDDSQYSLITAYRGAGTREYWDRAWDALYPELAPPDRYDVNSPSSGVSNGPGSRAKNYHLTSQYRTIVWDCGDYEACTITDGTVNSDKSNDCQMLIDWMDLSPHHVGLWVCGDDVAFDLAENDNSAVSRTFLNNWCGVSFVTTSYFELTGGRTGGGVVNPFITGDTDLNLFVHSGVPDVFYIDGGCWIMNQFDVLGKTNGGRYALHYPAHNATNYYAGISHETTNYEGYDVHTLWFGFSFRYIRDASNAVPQIRVHLALDAFEFLGAGACHEPACLSPAETPKAYCLAQNYPNPFNPSTTIRYDMKEKGIVTLKIYNVAGELVRTLVDGIKDAGAYSITWDGRNNLGVGVASGIYFYKMDVAGFSATKKLVMLR